MVSQPIVTSDYPSADLPPQAAPIGGHFNHQSPPAGWPVGYPAQAVPPEGNLSPYQPNVGHPPQIPIDPRKPTCLARLIKAAGVDNDDPGVVSPSQLQKDVLHKLLDVRDYKVFYVVYVGQVDDPRNHVELVLGDEKSSSMHVAPVGGPYCDRREYAVTAFQQFFNPGAPLFRRCFYATDDDDDDEDETPGRGFGGDLRAARPRGPVPSAVRARPARERSVNSDAHGGSIVDEDARSGGNNVTGGVVRGKRRVIEPRRAARLGGRVAKNYVAAGGVMFNNLDEVFQDTISREHAQEIIESVLETWGIPFDQPEALKYCEDLIWSFLIATTASNKADYDKIFSVPLKATAKAGGRVTSAEVNFLDFSKTLESEFGVSRRQFARGTADDMRDFLRLEENTHLLPLLATRVGCEVQLAHLAFDGSTHCSGMTPKEIAFTKTLESRNLFENEAVLANDASARLLAGTNGGRPLDRRA